MNKTLKLLFFINFCISSFLISVQLNYGDALCLFRNGRNTFYLSTKLTSSGYVLASQKSVATNESIKFYIQPGNSINRLDGCGPNNPVKSGDIIRLETSTHSQTIAPSFLAYNYTSGLSRESAPALYPSAFYGTDTIVPNVSGYLFKILKINSNISTISEGDSIVIMAYYNNQSTFLPFYLGAKEQSADPTQADLLFMSSTTTDNPPNFPVNYCWFVSTIIANASVSDSLQNKPIINKDNSSWPTPINSDFSNINLLPDPPTPLRYGDGFVLRHKEYGTYLTILGGKWADVVASPSLGKGSSWLAEFGNSAEDWGPGNNKLGVRLTSGAYLRMGNFDFFGGAADHDYRMYMYPGNGPALASNPNPPFCRAQVYDHKYAMCTRIYKYWATVGDPISKGDIVYFYNYDTDTKTDLYLGSANLAVGLNKEVFLYRSKPSSPLQPPNFLKQDLWIIDDIFPDSYKTQPKSGTWSNICYPLSALNIWPSVISRQF